MKPGEADPPSQALFLRACRLGVASACTNAAAGVMVARDRGDAPADDCPERTFARTCEADDAWGCTMSGRALAMGEHVKEDPPRARERFERACRRDEGDPACAAARELSKGLDIR